MIQNCGLVERNLLQKPNIRNVDFEVYGCNRLPGSDFYLEGSVHHCPVRERHAFNCWFTTNVLQNKYFVICLIIAFNFERWGRVSKNPGFLFDKIEKSLAH